MNTEIDNRFLNINNKRTVIAASFLTMGLTCFFSGIPISSLGIIPASLSLPFLVLSIATHLKLKKENYLDGRDLDDLFLAPLYKREFKKWLNNYLDDSQSLAEKKYKLIFTSMWMSSRFIKTQNLMDSYPEDIAAISMDMMKKKETKNDLLDLFVDHNKTKSYQEFFNEDKDNTEKLDIAKKVYNDFRNIGLVGKYFRYWSASEMLCLIPLQDYQLSHQDIDEIKKLTQLNIKTPEPFRQNLFFTELSFNYCLKIMDKNIEHVEVLRNFFHSMSQDDKSRELLEMLEQMEKSITLSSALEEKLPISLKTEKRKKI